MRWARCDGGSFGGTEKSSALFLRWLVEVHLDTLTVFPVLPVLVKVGIWDYVIVLNHVCNLLKNI
jgi:hypothetical protein